VDIDELTPAKFMENSYRDFGPNCARMTLVVLLCSFGIFSLARAAEPSNDVHVELFTGSKLEDVKDVELREAMKNAGMRPAPIGQFGEMRTAAEGLQKMITRLVDPKEDKITHYKVMLLDDLRPMAKMLRPGDTGITYIFISTGSIYASQNDDQLAHFLSHEMDHGSSQLHEFAESLSPGHDGRRSKIPMSPTEVYMRGLERAEESEVDIKGMMRMHRAGYNPYEAEKLMVHLAELEGDSFNFDHPTYLARRNALAAASTVYTRLLGRSADSRKPVQTAITKPFATFVTSKPYVAFRKRELAGLQKNESSAFQNFLRRLKVAKPDDKIFGEMIEDRYHVGTVAQVLGQESAKRMERARAIWNGVLPEVDQTEYLMTLNRNLTENRRRAVSQILGSNYQAQNAQVGEILYDFVREDPIRRIVGGGNYLQIIEIGQDLGGVNDEIREIQTQLRIAGTVDEKDAAESRLKTLLGKRAALQQAFDGQKKLFRPSPELDQMLETATRAVIENTGNMKPKITMQLEPEILKHLKSDYSTISERTRTEATAMVSRWMRDVDFRLSAEEVGAFSAQVRAFDPAFWKQNGEKLIGKIDGRFAKKLAEIPKTAEAAEERLVLFEAASRLHNLLSTSMIDAGVPDARAIANETARSMHQRFVAEARSPIELGALLPEKIEKYGPDIKTLSLQNMQNQFFLIASDDTRISLLKPPFAETFLRKSLEFSQTALSAAKVPRDVTRVIDAHIGSLLALKREGIIDDAMARANLLKFRAEVLKDFRVRYFGSEIEVIASKHAQSLWNAQYGFDASDFIPLSAAEKKVAAIDLAKFKKIPALHNTFSASGLEYLTSPASQSDFSKMLIGNSELVGRPAGVRPVAEETLGRVWTSIVEVVNTDVANQKLAASLSKSFIFPKSEDESMKSYYKRQEAQRLAFQKMVQTTKQSAKATVSRIPQSRDYAKLFETWGGGWGQESLAYEWLSSNQSKSLDGLVTDVDTLMEIGPGYIEGSKHALKSEAEELRVKAGVRATPEYRANSFSRFGGPFEGKIQRWESAVFQDRTAAEVKSILSSVDPEKLTRYLNATKLAGGKEVYRDLMLERVLEAAVAKPDLLKQVSDPELVRSFRFPDTRKKLAALQLDQKLGLASKRQAVLKSKEPIVQKTDVRNVVKDARKLIDQQFPDQTGEKTMVVEAFEQRISTSHAEAQYLRDIRITSDNWMRTKDLTKLEIPYVISAEMRSSMDRLEMLDYLVGRTNQAPKFLRKPMQGNYGRQITERLETARREVMTADTAVRSFMLQSFLDDQKGILAEPRVTDRLFQNILGESYNNPMINELFHAYLGEIPESEKKVVLSFIYSSFADAKGVKQASLKTILEAMGPLGIKAGQFLRTSGRLSKPQQAELEEFFSNALPRHRPGMYTDFERVFGSDLGPVASVRETVGSGSINYGARADFAVEGESAKREAIVRFRKEGVPGQIQNENRNWERVAARLSKSEKTEVRGLAQTLNEARLAAMDTLKEGGVELDLGYERRMYPVAKAAYEAPRNPKTGYRIEVVKPIEDLQALIPADLQDSVSVYEYIQNEKFKSLPVAEQKALAEQIVGAELDAMFKKNSFDPDGHVGNWLIDTKTKRLVRIDYAQMRSVDPNEMKKIKSVLNALFIPRPDVSEIQTIARNLGSMLEFPKTVLLGEKEKFRLIEEAVHRIDFPSNMDPHQRLFMIRDQLEKKLSNSTGQAVSIPIREDARAVISSLGRLLYFRDFMDEKQFFKTFATHMDLPVGRILRQLNSPMQVAKIALKAAADGLRSQAERVGSAVSRAAASATEACVSFYGRLGKGR
jgi:hypothetical protein